MPFNNDCDFGERQRGGASSRNDQPEDRDLDRSGGRDQEKMQSRSASAERVCSDVAQRTTP